jgi:hypothetical protein
MEMAPRTDIFDNEITIAIKETKPPILMSWLSGLLKEQGWAQALVYRQALRRAYVRFEKRYPEWAGLWFDEHFLTHRAAPLLGRYLEDGTLPAPIELARAWDEQLGPTRDESLRQGRITKLTPGATDFLALLEEELA